MSRSDCSWLSSWSILFSVKDSATSRNVNAGSCMLRTTSTLTTRWVSCFHHQPDSHQSMSNMITLFVAWLVHSPSVNPQAPSRDWASKISKLVNQPSSPFDKCAYNTSVNSITPSNNNINNNNANWPSISFLSTINSLSTTHLILYIAASRILHSISRSRMAPTIFLTWIWLHTLTQSVLTASEPSQNLTHFGFGLLTWPS